MIVRIVLFLVCLLAAAPARADEYADATTENLVKTLVRFGAINLDDDTLLDEYAFITECDLVQNFYADDFKWNKVRAAIRDSVRLNIATFPTAYHFDSKLQLGRYDFDNKLYRFTNDSLVHNVNSFVFTIGPGDTCGTHEIKVLPTSYNIVLDAPVSFLGLPFAERDADALLQRMNKSGNKEHIIYTRFNLRIVYVEPLRKTPEPSVEKTLPEDPKYAQIIAGGDHELRLDGRLESVEFYEDPAATKMVYSYQP